ncbi:MAG: hypothetical protein L0210_14565 [Rhodospirillales bacterium]|nr:hypothetical protein [Rhodospirillales bacterium]
MTALNEFRYGRVRVLVATDVCGAKPYAMIWRRCGGGQAYYASRKGLLAPDPQQSRAGYRRRQSGV